MIDVVMPLYNNRSVVARSINSVIRQTETQWRLIIVDDGSTDGSDLVATKIADDRIMLIRQENAGASAARNAGIVASGSELIAFLDADDEWEPDFLERILKLKRDFPEADWFATAYSVFHPRDGHRVLKLNGRFRFFERGVIPDYFGLAIAGDPPVCSSAVVVKKNLMEEVGGFPVGVSSGEDLLTWAKLSRIGTLAYDARPSANHYVSTNDRAADANQIVGQALMAMASEPCATPNVRKYVAKWYCIQVTMAIRSRARVLAIVLSVRAIQYHPTSLRGWFCASRAILPWAIGDAFYRHLKLSKLRAI